MIVALYLIAIVAANLLIAEFGPDAAIIVAFAFVGLDLTARDALHDRWRHDHLWLRMLALIAAGGILSWFVNRDAGWIAVASTVAFLAAGAADVLVYQVLGDRSRRLRVNGSNVVSAAVDSLVFPTLAFGALLPVIVIGQWVAKVIGGAIWLEVLSALSLWKGRTRPAVDQDA
jgi:queuosine precursor transporter